MSMMLCRCGAYIDTDYDVESFVGDEPVCSSCQDELIDEGEIVESEDGVRTWAVKVER